MRTADRVYTRQEDIDRLQAMLLQLPQGEAVELRLRDGRSVSGYVVWHPSIQQFFDPEGKEGSNVYVRLEQPALEAPMETPPTIGLFLDEVEEIRALDLEELQPVRHAQTGTPAGRQPRRPDDTPYPDS